ncbi:MAG: nucleotidyltransferase domain-containing protein [Planctomycetes bacterium]|nr:nucleotidyltransferase domain-containing protein [Planctomycetota bacterium]
MVQEQSVVREKVSRFYREARQSIPVKKVLLYGSYAKGSATESSDIDVAVIIDISDHLKRIDLTSKLFHIAGQIDVAIEPKCVFLDEYLDCPTGSILYDIISTGIEVV